MQLFRLILSICLFTFAIAQSPVGSSGSGDGGSTDSGGGDSGAAASVSSSAAMATMGECHDCPHIELQTDDLGQLLRR